MLEEFAGLLSVIVTIMGSAMSLAYAPQAYKIWRRRSVADISLPFFIIMFVGLIFWLLYGISIASTPLIIPNAIGVLGAGLIVLLYLKYKK